MLLQQLSRTAALPTGVTVNPLRSNRSARSAADCLLVDGGGSFQRAEYSQHAGATLLNRLGRSTCMITRTPLAAA